MQVLAGACAGRCLVWLSTVWTLPVFMTLPQPIVAWATGLVVGKMDQRQRQRMRLLHREAENSRPRKTHRKEVQDGAVLEDTNEGVAAGQRLVIACEQAQERVGSCVGATVGEGAEI